MKFALFMIVASRGPECRRWFRRWIPQDGSPAWSDDFGQAMPMNIEEAAEAYRKCDSLGRVLGLVPIEQ